MTVLSARRCRGCQDPFQRRSDVGRPPVYCSAGCRDRAKNARAREARSVARGARRPAAFTCERCGTTYIATRRRRWCSRGCRVQAGLAVTRIRAAERKPPCRWCGERIPFGLYRRVFCGDWCASRYSVTKKILQRGLDRGRGRLIAAILERDGWECWRCGRPCQHGHPNARHRLVLVHQVRLVDGGQDLPENLRISCLSCAVMPPASAARDSGPDGPNDPLSVLTPTVGASA
jgi:hypothetical protein